MKNRWTFLLIFIIIRPLWAKSLEERICGNKFNSASLSSDWKINNSPSFCEMYPHHCNEEMRAQEYEIKRDKVGKTFCASASCFNENQKVELQKCFYQTTSNLFHYIIKRQENKVTESRTFSFPITDKDVCYEDCKTIKNRFLPFSILETRGLNRESCQKCFMERDDDINFDKSSISYPEIGQKFYRGQKCFELCKDPDDRIVFDRKLSLDCQKCVGINGYKGDSFRFIKTKNGECFEVENDLKIRATIPQACNSEKTTFTFFKKEKSSTFYQFFKDAESPCFEMDNQSGGRLLIRQTDQSHCEKEQFPNNINRNMPVEKITPSTTPDSSTQPSRGHSR